MDERAFESLLTYLRRVPAIDDAIGHGAEEDGTWWLKFAINIGHPLAWRVVQELGHVLNYVSVEERLPTTFKPVSPPPYLNGGPDEFLSWVIEAESPEFTPDLCAEWLEGRLPRPVDSGGEWAID